MCVTHRSFSPVSVWLSSSRHFSALETSNCAEDPSSMLGLQGNRGPLTIYGSVCYGVRSPLTLSSPAITYRVSSNLQVWTSKSITKDEWFERLSACNSIWPSIRGSKANHLNLGDSLWKHYGDRIHPLNLLKHLRGQKTLVRCVACNPQIRSYVDSGGIETPVGVWVMVNRQCLRDPRAHGQPYSNIAGPENFGTTCCMQPLKSFPMLFQVGYIHLLDSGGIRWICNTYKVFELTVSPSQTLPGQKTSVPYVACNPQILPSVVSGGIHTPAGLWWDTVNMQYLQGPRAHGRAFC